jgi:hypothetical protein
MLDKISTLVALVNQWEKISRRVLLDAGHEKHPVGKLLIEKKL